MLRSTRSIFFLVLGLGLLVSGGHLYSPDEEIMFRVTESLATRASLDVEPILDPNGGTFATQKGVNGREYAQYGVGNSLFAVPLYWAGAAACRVISDGDAYRLLNFKTVNYVKPGPGSGHALLKRFAVSFFGALVAAATAALLMIFCRGVMYSLGAPASNAKAGKDAGATSHIWQAQVPGFTALLYGAGSIALPHSRTFFSEPLATFFCLLAFYFAGTGSVPFLTRKRALLSGLAFALALLTRLDSVFISPALGLLMLWKLPAQSSALVPSESATPSSASRLIERIRYSIRRRAAWSSVLLLMTFGLPILAFGLFHLALNHAHFGNAFTSAYADQSEGIRFTTPLLAGLYGFLMSIGKSVFLFSPVIVLGLLGFPAFLKLNKPVAVCAGLAILLKLLIQSRWQNWAGGWCWGPRHVFLIHAFIMLPACAYLARRTLTRRFAADALLLVGVLVQLYGSSQNFIDYYILYYRTPHTFPNATVMFGNEDIAPQVARAEMVGPDGTPVTVGLQALPAPINDSIYVPQNSQWYRYAEMWNLGYTDNLWLRLIQRGRGQEQPVK